MKLRDNKETSPGMYIESIMSHTHGPENSHNIERFNKLWIALNFMSMSAWQIEHELDPEHIHKLSDEWLDSIATNYHTVINEFKNINVDEKTALAYIKACINVD